VIRKKKLVKSKKKPKSKVEIYFLIRYKFSCNKKERAFSGVTNYDECHCRISNAKTITEARAFFSVFKRSKKDLARMSSVQEKEIYFDFELTMVRVTVRESFITH